jgi:hypothetical protein
LEARVRDRFPPLKSLKQLVEVLPEELYNIPLETARNLDEPIPKGIAAILKTKNGPVPY